MKRKIILLTTFVLFQAFTLSFGETDSVKEFAVQAILEKNNSDVIE